MKRLLPFVVVFSAACGFQGFDYCDYHTIDGYWNACIVVGTDNNPSQVMVTSWIRQVEDRYRDHRSSCAPVQIEFLDDETVPARVHGFDDSDVGRVYGYSEVWPDRSYIYVATGAATVSGTFIHEFSHVYLHYAGITGSENNKLVHGQ